MEGRMFEYDAERNLVAFRSGESSDVLLFLGGLNDGFMCRKYVPLIQQASAPHWTVMQVQLGSFFRGWGTRSLHQDVEDIDLLLQYMCDHGMTPRRLVLMGSSTGCQQAVLFLKEGRLRQLVSGLVLQAPVSDREAPWTDAHAELLEQATRMLQQGKGNELMPVAAASAPISAYRYHALAARLGDDGSPRTSLPKNTRPAWATCNCLC
jgi:pimeloyl-ACP methyl ester carboxylesterase